MRTLWNVWEELIQGYQTAFVPLENLYPNNASVKALLQQIVIEAALLLAPPCNTTIQSLDNGKINGGQFYKYVLVHHCIPDVTHFQGPFFTLATQYLKITKNGLFGFKVEFCNR